MQKTVPELAVRTSHRSVTPVAKKGNRRAFAIQATMDTNPHRSAHGYAESPQKERASNVSMTQEHKNGGHKKTEKNRAGNGKYRSSRFPALFFPFFRFPRSPLRRRGLRPRVFHRANRFIFRGGRE
jgi:hypothetical protein